ncbi:hypothetical protein EDB92DRAFT_2057256 [Lactarius akahatsu]|uniref:Wax synthase domain-containing protein n=1 Tax=Lactarius akahatsu TaxID=416441 RepID=A0AAD4LRE0_9AGAM|nr:hypothetical protein EDB92DRAFT_2057256 [Lactarius akahatsu]
MVDFFLGPDLSLRRPEAVTALLPHYLTYYALGVLAILPNTFYFRLLLQPVFLWQTWWCVANVDFAAWLAQSLGLQNSDTLKFWNGAFAVGMFIMTLQSFEWAFLIKEPLRKYEITTDQNPPTFSKNLKPLSISSVLLDGFDLFFNLRGIGWSWSSQPSPRSTTPPSSIPSLFALFLLRIAMADASQYIIQRVSPAVISGPSGGSIFDPNLSLLPRIAAAALCGICGGVWTYSLIDGFYYLAALFGRVVCRQPASHWPPVSNRPWVSTSLHEFWSTRWHQLFRHLFVTFGARPGAALLGRPGALICGFAVSGVMHNYAAWGTGYGSDFFSVGGFFILMGAGVAMEVAFKKSTGVRVGGFFGWLWTMLWVLVCGTFMIDSWGRHGMLATTFLPARLRLGKPPVDAVIGLLNVAVDRWDVGVGLGKLNESVLRILDMSSISPL